MSSAWTMGRSPRPKLWINGLTRTVKVGFHTAGKACRQCVIESFNASFRKECLNAHWLNSLDEAKQVIEAWRIEYNATRPHSSLGNLALEELVEKHEMERVIEARILTR